MFHECELPAVGCNILLWHTRGVLINESGYYSTIQQSNLSLESLLFFKFKQQLIERGGYFLKKFVENENDYKTWGNEIPVLTNIIMLF